MVTSGVLIIAILALNIAICEFLVSKTALKHFGTALLVIVLTAIEANMGILPSASPGSGVYDHIFSYIAPLAIFYLLLECSISSLKKAGLPIIGVFLLGSLGTFVGAIIGISVVGGASLGEFYPQIAGMFTGTYTGGSINFNAVALEYNINEEGNLYAGAVAIDNIWTAMWMVLTIAIPKFAAKYLNQAVKTQSMEPLSIKDENDSEVTNPYYLSLLLFIGISVLLLSNWLSELSSTIGFDIPSILILTTISLILAQIPVIRSISGSRILGILGIYFFLAVIGAYCDFATLPEMGPLAYSLFLFISIMVLIHGIITFGVGRIFIKDWDMLAVASQANIGGSGSALALARSIRRNDLFLAAILIGTIGNALGTYLGFLVVAIYA